MQYLLTGKLFCGNCETPMAGESGTSATGTIYNYYKCQSRKKQRSCNKANERKEALEKFVVLETVKRLREDGVIDEIVDTVTKLAEREYNDNSRLTALQDELKTVQVSIRNLLRLVEQGIDTDDVGERLKDLDAQKTDLNAQIGREEHKKPLINRERVSYFLKKLAYEGDPDDPEYQRKVIDTLVNRVYLFDTDGGGRRIIITYNLSNNLKSTVTLRDIEEHIKSSYSNCLGSPKAKCVPQSGTHFAFGGKPDTSLKSTSCHDFCTKSGRFTLTRQ